MKTTCIFSIIIVMILFSLRTNAQNWDQIVKTCASDRNGEEYYGKSVAIDGDFAIVGAWGQDRDTLGNNHLPQAGAAYILQNINDSWVEIQKITASDRASEDNFGYAVDIKGDYAVVGAWRVTDSSNSPNIIWTAGAAYVFHNNEGTWEETQKIIPLDGKKNQYFGNSVSIDGDYIVIGAFNDNKS
ncbi:MAG: FG-GAP repeat protein, partial [Bacteroidales bacterium]|nr:FG-GAP repeat protein [Bacteroidales bacterium]